MNQVKQLIGMICMASIAMTSTLTGPTKITGSEIEAIHVAWEILKTKIAKTKEQKSLANYQIEVSKKGSLIHVDFYGLPLQKGMYTNEPKNVSSAIVVLSNKLRLIEIIRPQ